MFTPEELKKLEQAFSDRPNFKTHSGYTGNKKSKAERAEMKIGNKRRRTDHLSNKERKQLVALRKKSMR